MPMYWYEEKNDLQFIIKVLATRQKKSEHENAAEKPALWPHLLNRQNRRRKKIEEDNDREKRSNNKNTQIVQNMVSDVNKLK